MNRLARAILTVFLLISLPLQGQAAIVSDCHSGGVFSHPMVLVEGAIHAGHASADDHAHGQSDMISPDTTKAASTNLTGASAGCAACSGLCTMPLGLFQPVTQRAADYRSPEVFTSPSSQLVSVYLDGLLRPPRS